jgi:uncharacterized membrane protein
VTALIVYVLLPIVAAMVIVAVLVRLAVWSEARRHRRETTRRAHS